MGSFPGMNLNMELFDSVEEGAEEAASPLAERMRPKTLDAFVGQSHILGKGFLQHLINHCMTAIFNDQSFTIKLSDIGQ